MRTVIRIAFAFVLMMMTAATALADAKSVAYTPAVLAEAQAAGKFIVVDVYADWCPTCQAQKPIMSELKADPAVKDVLFVTVDFDREKKFLRAHRVAYQATILVFKGNEELARSTAETNRNRLRSTILTSLAKAK